MPIVASLNFLYADSTERKHRPSLKHILDDLLALSHETNSENRKA